MIDLAITGMDAWTGHGGGLRLGPGLAPAAAPYQLRELVGPRAPRRLDRLSELALIASARAMAGRGDNTLASSAGARRSAVFFATGHGNLSGTVQFLGRLQDKGARFASPLEFPNLVLSAPAGALSLFFGFKGELLGFNQGALSGIFAFVSAVDAIRGGRADVALVSGAEELSPCRQRFAEVSGARKASCSASATNGGGCIPLGEGAAALVLERGSGAVRCAGIGLSGKVGEAGLAAAGARALAQAECTGAELILARADSPIPAAWGSPRVDLAERVGFFEALTVLELAYGAHVLRSGQADRVLVASVDRAGGAGVVVLARGAADLGASRGNRT